MLSFVLQRADLVTVPTTVVVIVTLCGGRMRLARRQTAFDAFVNLVPAASEDAVQQHRQKHQATDQNAHKSTPSLNRK